jgi:hypothetical protein
MNRCSIPIDIAELSCRAMQRTKYRQHSHKCSFMNFTTAFLSHRPAVGSRAGRRYVIKPLAARYQAVATSAMSHAFMPITISL